MDASWGKREEEDQDPPRSSHPVPRTRPSDIKTESPTGNSKDSSSFPNFHELPASSELFLSPLARSSQFKIGNPYKFSAPEEPPSGLRPSVFVCPSGSQRLVASPNSEQEFQPLPIKSEDPAPFKYPVRTDSAMSFPKTRCQDEESGSSQDASSGIGCTSGSEGAFSGKACSDAGTPPPELVKDLESLLAPEDYSDLKDLQDSYHRAFENISVPMENRMIRPEELSKLYSCFIKRRAHFLVSTPLYNTLASVDRPKLLRIAVSMCTYITGAHLMDTRNFRWPKQAASTPDAPTPMLSAGTIRQYLSHEQFIRLMRFYITYASYYCDERIAILMQVLSLVYPETGLANPGVVEEGRRRYGGLLSRYLLAVYGPEVGINMFRALLNSQTEMRQLAEINQHVELVPQVSQCEDTNVGAMLNKGIQLVCDGAKEMIDQLTKRQPRSHEKSVISTRQRLPVESKSRSQTEDLNQLVIIKDVLQRLANCNDPKLLEEARRIIPTDLLKQFHEMLE